MIVNEIKPDTIPTWKAEFLRKEYTNVVLEKIKAEIIDCLNALDEIEKTGVNIYLPNEISGRRLTYRQCLKIIDKYIEGSEPDETRI